MQSAHNPSKTAIRAVLGATCICVLGVSVAVGASLADDLCSTQTVVGSDLLGPYDGYMMPDERGPGRVASPKTRDDAQWTPMSQDDSREEGFADVLMSTTRAWSASAVR